MTFATHDPFMNRYSLLASLVLGGSLSAVNMNSLAGQIQGTPSVQATHPSSDTNVRPVFQGLHLFINPANGETEFGGVSGLHGRMYMARRHDWRVPDLAQTNRVDMLSGGSRIVVMVLDNGPIYSSTNSGMTWTVIDTPGEYQFPLTIGPKGGGMLAKATILPSPDNQTTTNSSLSTWYAVGSGPNGSMLVLTGDVSQPAPALTIAHSGGGVIVSWPAAFTGYVLQENSDLSSTNWVDVTNSVNVVGGENQVLISSPADNNFYRLKSQ